MQKIMSPRLFVSWLAGLLVVGLLAGAALSVAAKPRYSSKVSLNTATEGAEFVFRGRVRSVKPACRRNRRVQVWAGMDQSHFEGATRTNRRGRFELRVLAEANTIANYQAVALRKARPRFVCKRAKSAVVPF